MGDDSPTRRGRTFRFLTRAWTLPLVLTLAPFAFGAFQESAKDESDRLFAEGRRLYQAGETIEAGRVFRRVVPMLRDGDEPALLASALNALSAIDSSEGLYDQAIDAAREAASIRQSLGDRPGQGDSLTNLGLALSYLGKYDSALNSYREALSLYESDQDWEGVTLLRNNIGNVLLYLGRYGEAFSEYQKALETCRTHPDAAWSGHQRHRTLINLAALHQKIGAYDRALEIYSSLDAAGDVLSGREEARLFSNRGALYRHLGDAAKAMDSYRRAQALHREGRDSDGEIGVLKNIGIAQALDLGDLEGALETFETALSLAEEAGNRREAIQSRLYRAETLRRLDRLDEATRDLEAVAATASELGAAEEEWKALYGLGRVAEARGLDEEARRHYETAVERIESVQARLQLPSLTPGFLADKRQAYDALIGLLVVEATGRAIDAGSFSEISRLIEQARSAPFRERFADKLGSGRDPDLGGRLRELRARAATLWQSQIQASPERRREIQAQLAEIENQYLTLSKGPDRDSFAADGTFSIDSIQTRLPEDALLLQYWVGAGQAAVLAWSRSRFELKPFPFGVEEEDDVRECARDLGDPSSERWVARCSRVARNLFGSPSVVTSEFEKLVLILDRPLNSVPFEGLPYEEGLLLERLEVEYLPGLSFLRQARDGGDWSRLLPWSRSLLAFGAPDPPSGTNQPDEFGEVWPRLPGAEGEVRAAAELLPGASTVETGASADKANLLKRLSEADYPVVHLATHAVADPEDPERSRILLTSASPDQPYQFLFLGEVLDLDLGGDGLVVLSACETGRSRSRLPGGSHDFGEAFLRSGAQSVAVTLWRVSDQASTDFMVGFYSRLAQGDTPAAALRSAKLRLLRSDKSLRHPFFWAGFVLYGDGFSALPLPISWLRLAIALTLLAGVAGSLLAWRLSRR